MKSIGDSSSGCLIDIQIDESLNRETLMNIDSTNQKENCGIFTTCFVFLALCLFSRLFLPNLTTTLKNNYELHNHNADFIVANNKSSTNTKQRIEQKYVTFSIESLSTLNQFLLLSISFIRNDNDISDNSINFSENDFVMLSADISVTIDLSNQVHETYSSSNSFPNSKLFFPKDQNLSQKMLLLKSQITKYTSFTSTITISRNSNNTEFFDDIIGCRAYWTFGNSTIPLYQSFIKLLFFALNLISMISFLFRIKCNTSVLHLEQIISIFLLIFIFFIDNPFHYLFLVKLPKVSIIFDEISKTVFNIYLRFFIYVLFDSLRFKNRRIGHCFFIPKILFFFFFLCFELILSFIQTEKVTDFKWSHPNSQVYKTSDIDNNNNFFQNEFKISKQLDFYSNERLLHNNLYFGLINDDKNNEKNLYEKSAFFLTKISELIYIACLILVIIRSFREIDVTERYKFFTYFSVSFTMILLIGLSDCFLSRSKKFANTLTPFLFKLSVYNFYALLMMFFHWPYELITDQQYLDPDDVEVGVADFYNESDKSSGIL